LFLEEEESTNLAMLFMLLGTRNFNSCNLINIVMAEFFSIYFQESQKYKYVSESSNDGQFESLNSQRKKIPEQD